MASADSYSSPPPSPLRDNPILRNALRYAISEKEYENLQKYLLSRTPPAIRKHVPPLSETSPIARTNNDFNAAAVRASVRVFVTSQTGLKLWDLVKSRVLEKEKSQKIKAKVSVLRSPNFRLSLALSLILLLHRLFFRFFTRLRSNLLTKDAAPFRQRNPRIARSLTSRLAPALGASLAGFALGIYPADQLRITIAIYVATRAAEFTYNLLDNEGWFRNKPWWWGSWMMMPFAAGQLLHAFVFDRDCFPKAYGDFILSYTPNYLQRRPATYPPSLAWPEPQVIVDSLAEISRLRWPPFTSPILFALSPTPLPSTVSSISPITAPAHPSLKYLSCALLHPSTPSCSKTFVTYILTAFPPLAKFFTLLFGLFSLPRYKSFLSSPFMEINRLAKRVLQMTTFITMAIGTSWASICLFASILPRTFLPTQRWFLGGFLGGWWAFLERSGGRGNFMYSVRLSIDSLWKVGKKRGWWKGIKGGDVGLFVLGLAVANGVFEKDKSAVQGGVIRRGFKGLRGDGWQDSLEESRNEKEKGR